MLNPTDYRLLAELQANAMTAQHRDEIVLQWRGKSARRRHIREA